MEIESSASGFGGEIEGVEDESRCESDVREG